MHPSRARAYELLALADETLARPRPAEPVAWRVPEPERKPQPLSAGHVVEAINAALAQERRVTQRRIDATVQVIAEEVGMIRRELLGGIAQLRAEVERLRADDSGVTELPRFLGERHATH